MEFNSEEEFLKVYDSSKIEKLSITTDILTFSLSDEVSNNYRKFNKKHFSILFVKRDKYPFKDKQCLPGGFVGIEKAIEDAAKKILENDANIKDIYIEQLYTLGNPKRDPRMRIVSVSYMALIDNIKLNNKISKKDLLFNVSVLEDEKEIFVTLDNGEERIRFKIKKTLKEKTQENYKWSMKLFQVKKSLDPAFRRIIADKVEKTDKMKTGGGHRPSYLFKHRKSNR